jgi:hypothetical protein
VETTRPEHHLSFPFPHAPPPTKKDAGKNKNSDPKVRAPHRRPEKQFLLWCVCIIAAAVHRRNNPFFIRKEGEKKPEEKTNVSCRAVVVVVKSN